MDYFTVSYRIILTRMIILTLITKLHALLFLPEAIGGKRPQPCQILETTVVYLVQAGEVC